MTHPLAIKEEIIALNHCDLVYNQVCIDKSSMLVLSFRLRHRLANKEEI